MEENKRRSKKKLFAFIGFITVFGAMIYFGYNHFVKPRETAPVNNTTGLNNKLPSATAPKELNKLELYMQAEKDSLTRATEKENDPNTKRLQTGLLQPQTKEEKKNFSLPKYTGKVKPLLEVKKSKQEDEIDQKMRELNRLLKSEPVNVDPIGREPVGQIPQEVSSPRETKAVSVDPELEKLDGMLDKLMNMQHPPAVKEVSNETKSLKTPVVNANKVSSAIPNQTIQAVVHNTQTIGNGATIKLRLLNDIMVKEKRIAKGSFLFGIAQLSNERLVVQLTNINHINTVIPVSLSVFDIDGIEGIYIPGAVERETAKESSDLAIQSVNLANFNPTVSGQLTSAGIQATKSLLSKKVRMQRVTVKAGHHILLQNTN